MDVRKLAVQVVESVLSVGGIRVGTEEPHHLRRPLTESVELRRYGPRIAAETVVAGDEDQARNLGFRRLARYIFGANHRSDEIAMTAPVAQQPAGGDEIAMTAPVAQSRQDDGGWRIRFFMPAKWTLETLPVPDDDGVRLVTVPGETVAVLRFSGDRGARAVAARTDELLQTLSDRGIDTIGDAAAWFYDPPWTLPFRRRNEIVVPVGSTPRDDRTWVST
ncbi:SOUL family heme-binding protein [Actinomycetospora chibensis]|uniref:SOUL family heme-binding protein n=1 Tax=Actinomycetospora chibensis TaxID=663606 RepID=A0ABV9RD75_9PSEU|nr:heme-binding protein [Actinomycetospora chibensis]MDD7922159.1 heme-binding protein [Actinomycetospora chibensis]